MRNFMQILQPVYYMFSSIAHCLHVAHTEELGVLLLFLPVCTGLLYAKSYCCQEAIRPSFISAGMLMSRSNTICAKFDVQVTVHSDKFV